MATRQTTSFNLRMTERLRKLIVREAAKARLPCNEWIARTLAEKFGDPTLGEIPRATPGRKPRVG